MLHLVFIDNREENMKLIDAILIHKSTFYNYIKSLCKEKFLSFG
jgi:hypothetical protein